MTGPPPELYALFFHGKVFALKGRLSAPYGIYMRSRHENMGDAISLLFESNEKHEGVPPNGQRARWKEKNRAKRTAAAAAAERPLENLAKRGPVRLLDYQ